MRKIVIQCYQNAEMRVIMSSWGPGENEGGFTQEMAFKWIMEKDRNGGHSGKQTEAWRIYMYLPSAKLQEQLNGQAQKGNIPFSGQQDIFRFSVHIFYVPKGNS